METQELLLHAGLEVLTEKGFSATGIDEILSRVNVPKGSFYHYFASKEAYGLELIALYGAYFARKLDKHFTNEDVPPLERLEHFIEDAKLGMSRFDFRRGCLIGNLGQEMGSLPESFRIRLVEVFQDWERRLSQCLKLAQKARQIPQTVHCDQMASAFWIGWEGAVLRAKLESSAKPMDVFSQHFLASLKPA